MTHLAILVLLASVFREGTNADAVRLERRAEAMRTAVLAAESQYPTNGIVYYFAENGRDSNDGRSPARPMRTLRKASGLRLKPGDAVLFRRGDLFRGFLKAQAGVTYSAWGDGPKPTLCGSFRDYADPSLWKATAVSNVWRCTERLHDVGCVFFDFDPREVGRMDVAYGKMALPVRNEKFDRPVTLDEDLAFCNLFREDALLLRSDRGNPGARFAHIEIGTMAEKHLVTARDAGITVDNLHLTCCGGTAVGNHATRNFEVRNCVINHLGGSVLLGWKFGTVRFGNAVEVWDAVDGYRVHDNWIYQVYDTGVTHQRNDSPKFVCVMRNIEYWNNLIERCFWSIEYYNQRNAPGSRTENVYVHDNFCRFGGEGWGCAGRADRTPMYSFGDAPSFTANYRTERNVFDRSLGFLFFQSGKTLESKGAHAFRGNTYVQRAGGAFAKVHETVTPFTPESAPRLTEEMFGETDATFIRLAD